MKNQMIKRIVQTSTKSQQVYDSLTKIIASMEPGSNKFPSEEEMSESFGVSRAIVRDALARLRMDRIITSHQGIGTFGHPSVFSLENRIDHDTDFGVMLKEQYKNVQVDVRWEPLARGNGAFQEFFQEKPAILSSWIYSADNLKRLFTRFYLPAELIVKPLPQKLDIQSLPQFSKKYMSSSKDNSNYIDYCSMKCRVKTDDEACEQLDIPKGTPLLCFDEIIYNITDCVVGVGEVFVHPDNMVMSLVAPFKG